MVHRGQAQEWGRTLTSVLNRDQSPKPMEHRPETLTPLQEKAPAPQAVFTVSHEV